MVKLTCGQMVVLKSIPASLLDGLSAEDQEVIRAVVGQPLMFVQYDDYGRAEFEFTGSFGVVHTISIDSEELDILRFIQSD